MFAEEPVMVSLSDLNPFDLSRPRTITFRIVSLVVLILTPMLALSAWLAISYASAQRELLEARRIDVAFRVSAAIDREVAELFGMLKGLAASEDVLRGRFSEFEVHANRMVSVRQIARVFAFTKDGKIVFEADDETDSTKAVRLDPEFIEKVFKGQKAVSTVRGRGIAGSTIIVALPVFDGRRVLYGLGAESYVAPLSALFAESGLDSDWAAAVIDREGRYVARSLNVEERLGGSARPELVEVADGPAMSGTFENVMHEGIRVINTYHRSRDTGWTTVVAIPKSKITTPLRRVVIYSLIGAGTILTMTLLLTYVLAARISGPVRNLSQLAAALAGGKAFRETPHHITELDEVRLALEKAMGQSARLSAIVSSSADAIMSIDLDGVIRTWNKAAEDLFGYSAEEIVGCPKTVIVPEQRLAEYDEQRKRIMAGEAISVETMRRKKDGSLVSVRLRAAPVRRFDGKIIAVSSILHDITDKKAAEEHQRFLMRELAHRSKNQLAIIQSIASQTAKNSGVPEEFLDRLGKRLQGLAASHDLLSSRDWKGAPLGELISHQLEVFVDATHDKVEISGPDVRLDAAAAEAVGLAIHELATNAAKYGALSVPNGKVKVSWHVQPDENGEMVFRLDWEENGGPRVAPPSQKGFGSRVIEKMISASLGGKSEAQYRPEGVSWYLECPLASLWNKPVSDSA
jgi:PAS domain S-box-containing protein